MRRARIAAGGGALELDACRACQSIWFDPGELATFSPERQAPPAAEAPLPEAARRALGSAMASEIATDARERRRARQFADALTGGRRRRSGHWLADALIALCQA